ncbi:MAG: hypothetical protein ABSF67_12900 [Roseiarcus sp.]|jgi:hypothetical protein
MLAGSIGGFAATRVGAYPLAPSPAPLRFSEPTSDVFAQVAPRSGIATGVTFSDSIARLVAAGVIDPAKYRDYAGDLPGWVERALISSSDDPIVFNRETAPFLLVLLWAVGLANKAAINAKSPISTVRIPGFASTGGWSLGRQESGYVYFNSVEAVSLTTPQQAAVLEVATKTYRPCCDNSTFFQDCNHGSAILGLLQIAASQGALTKDLYRIGLVANSYWFSENYAKTALYFAHFHLVTWRELDPSLVLSGELSSASGWVKNIDEPLRRAGLRLPGASDDQQGC